VEAIDLLRGVVMAIMALDHVRDHLHRNAFAFDPTDASRTWVALYLTRWITHFCAPVFVFLAGTGAFLWGARSRSRGDLQRYLLTRGAWLIVLEATLIHLLWTFSPDPRAQIFQVIWAIGASMIVLAGLVALPVPWIAAIGAAIVFGHNALDPLTPERFGALAPLWQALHEGGTWAYAPPAGTVYFVYPLLPWIGVMALGYAFGALYAPPSPGAAIPPPATRRALLTGLGLGAIAVMIALRSADLYGDPRPWSVQPRGAIYTLLSFFDFQKYPPSLLFLLATLGPALVLAAAFERGTPRWLRPLLVFGRVPLFYYALHLLAIDVVTAVLTVARYGSRTRELFANTLVTGPPPDYGYGLGVVYAVWVALLVALYPACRAWERLKARRRDAWWVGYV
jgi:uncharacterized membrane protein